MKLLNNFIKESINIKISKFIYNIFYNYLWEKKNHYLKNDVIRVITIRNDWIDELKHLTSFNVK